MVKRILCGAQTALLAAACALFYWAPAVADGFMFTTTTDFSTGSSSVILLDGNCTVQPNVASVHSDAVCRFFDGRIYVVNRFGADNVQILDPAAGFATIRQFSVGAGSDPHDIVVVGPTKAYVTRYNSTDLWIVDPSTGAHPGTISLAAFADADGIPEMDVMARFGNYVFVTIQRLDRNNFYQPVGTSYVAVIDIATDTVVDVDPLTVGTQAITLLNANPFSEIKLDIDTGMLYVSAVHFFGLLDGGVETIDPVTLQATGVLFTESAAGGDINDVQIVSPTRGYAIIADPSFNTVLISFNPSTGGFGSVIYNPGGYVLNDIELSPDGVLFLCDRVVTAPGIRKYDAKTGAAITTGPISVGLPPFDMCFSVATPSGVFDETPPVATGLGPNYPNPFNPMTTIPFTLESAGRVQLAIYDVHGGCVRTLIDGARDAGPQGVVWDGRDDTATAVASGVYFVRLRAGGRAESRRLVLLK